MDKNITDKIGQNKQFENPNENKIDKLDKMNRFEKNIYKTDVSKKMKRDVSTEKSDM